MKKITSTARGIISGAAIFFLGLLAGGINGLLGAGGGALLVFALSGRKSDEKSAYAETVAVVGIMSVASAVIYGISYKLDFSSSATYALPAALGGALGGWLSGKIKTVWLNRVFAILVIYAGIRMVL